MFTSYRPEEDAHVDPGESGDVTNGDLGCRRRRSCRVLAASPSHCGIDATRRGIRSGFKPATTWYPQRSAYRTEQVNASPEVFADHPRSWALRQFGSARGL